MGLVSENFDDAILAQLPGDVAVGHTRYSTTGSTVLANAQPCSVNTRCGPLAIAHNGNLVNAPELKRELVEKGAIFTTSSDTEVLVHLIARSDAADGRRADPRRAGAGGRCLQPDHHRRPNDVRGGGQPGLPPAGARAGSAAAMVVASETCALDLVGASPACELHPGDFVKHRGGPHHPPAPAAARGRSPAASSSWCTSPAPTARSSASRWTGCAASSGRQLAREQPAPGAEVVFSVPDSSNAMALGYADASGIRLEHGLIRNHYVGRTFINPTQALRVAKVRIKFNPVREVIEGRSVVVVDDSLVRGNTSKELVQMIRSAGRAARCTSGWGRRPSPARVTTGSTRLPAKSSSRPRTRRRRSAASSAWTRWAISRSTGC